MFYKKNYFLYKKHFYASIYKKNIKDEYFVDVLLMCSNYKNASEILKKMKIKNNKIFRSIFSKLLVYEENPKKYLSELHLPKQLLVYCKDLIDRKYTYLSVPDICARSNTNIAVRQTRGLFSIKKIKNTILPLKSLNMPLVSIVMTAYNEEKYIASSIQSIRSQVLQNFELIVVNDASTDNTANILNRFQKLDQRIKVVHMHKNVGLWKAKNIGLTYCKANYITMHDADDWSHPLKLLQQYEILSKEKKVKMTTSYLIRVEEDTGRPFTRNLNSFIRWNPSSLMFHKKALKEIGNFLEDLLGSDGEFIARMEKLYGKEKHYKIKLPLTIAMNRKGSLSNLHRETNGFKRISDWEKWHRLHEKNGKKLFFQNYSIKNFKE